MRHARRWREIVTLATPVVISKLSFTAMAIVDTAMVGRLGPSEQAGVGIATTFMFTLYVFGLGLVGVVNTFVSQHHGAGHPGRCGVVLGHGLRLATAIGACTFVALLLSRPLFELAGLSAEVGERGYSYMFWRIMGLPGVFWYWAYNGYLEGLGETGTPMRITLAANVVNIAGDYLLIFGPVPFPAFGVEGAGMATAASNLFMLACFAVVIHRRRGPYGAFGARRIFAPLERALLARMLRVGLPMGVQFFAQVGAFLAFSVMVGWVGDPPLAAHQVALRLWSVSFMTAWGVSVAATTLVGRHQGEGRSDLAADAGQRAIRLVLWFTLAVALVYALIPDLLAGLFTSFPEVATLATTLVYVCAATQVLDGINIVSYGALKGAGDTRWPLWLVIVTDWLVGIPLVYALTIVAGLGVLGAWLGIGVVLLGQATAMYLRFRGGKWREIEVVE
jgi:MATE family multidrug resistance protein